jgi:hypothetical protein
MAKRDQHLRISIQGSGKDQFFDRFPFVSLGELEDELAGISKPFRESVTAYGLDTRMGGTSGPGNHRISKQREEMTQFGPSLRPSVSSVLKPLTFERRAFNTEARGEIMLERLIILSGSNLL